MFKKTLLASSILALSMAGNAAFAGESDGWGNDSGKGGKGMPGLTINVKGGKSYTDNNSDTTAGDGGDSGKVKLMNSGEADADGDAKFKSGDAGDAGDGGKQKSWTGDANGGTSGDGGNSNAGTGGNGGKRIYRVGRY